MSNAPQGEYLCNRCSYKENAMQTRQAYKERDEALAQVAVLRDGLDRIRQDARADGNTWIVGMADKYLARTQPDAGGAASSDNLPDKCPLRDSQCDGQRCLWFIPDEGCAVSVIAVMLLAMSKGQGDTP
jgi:hypothetical protein